MMWGNGRQWHFLNSANVLCSLKYSLSLNIMSSYSVFTYRIITALIMETYAITLTTKQYFE